MVSSCDSRAVRPRADTHYCWMDAFTVFAGRGGEAGPFLLLSLRVLLCASPTPPPPPLTLPSSCWERGADVFPAEPLAPGEADDCPDCLEKEPGCRSCTSSSIRTCHILNWWFCPSARADKRARGGAQSHCPSYHPQHPRRPQTEEVLDMCLLDTCLWAGLSSRSMCYCQGR